MKRWRTIITASVVIAGFILFSMYFAVWVFIPLLPAVALLIIALFGTVHPRRKPSDRSPDDSTKAA